MTKEYYLLFSYEIKINEYEKDPKKMREKDKAIKDLKEIKKYLNSRYYLLKARIVENEFEIDGEKYLSVQLEYPLVSTEDLLVAFSGALTYMLQNNVGKNLRIGRDRGMTLKDEIRCTDSYRLDPNQFNV